MDIGGKLAEITSLEKEIKSLRTRATDLGKRRQTLLTELIEYHKSIEVDSFAYKGKTFYIEQKTISTRKNKVDQKRDAAKALEKFGLFGEEARNVIEEVKSSLKGTPKVKEVLK